MILNQPCDGDEKDMDQSADEEVLAIPVGPMTRSRTKKLNEAIGGLLKKSWKQEESLRRGLIIQDTLITIQAIPSSS
ncbi:hypothetical protein Bca4012_098673 [Brassica carinata]